MDWLFLTIALVVILTYLHCAITIGIYEIKIALQKNHDLPSRTALSDMLAKCEAHAQILTDELIKGNYDKTQWEIELAASQAKELEKQDG